jgi:pimeloyl-ACP methyl ester carboxylesterase
MRRLRAGDRVLRVRDEGDAKKPPLVFVHGAGGSSVVWMDAVRRLQHRRRVIAPDLPGHGQSDRWHPADEVSIAMYRDAIGTVCALSKVERAVLVGHSMGGLVALAAAAAWPERVAGVVLIATGLAIPVGQRVFDVLERDFARAGEWLARVGFSPTSRDAAERWQGVLVTCEQDIAVADFRAVARWDGGALAAARVRAPVLVIGGADDLLTPPALQHGLGAALAGARVAIVPEAGHFPMLEQPERVFGELEQFLEFTS